MFRLPEGGEFVQGSFPRLRAVDTDRTLSTNGFNIVSILFKFSLDSFFSFFGVSLDVGLSFVAKFSLLVVSC